MKVAAMTATIYNPFDESHSGELLEGKLHEQFLWGGAGNGLRPRSVPRQSLTRQIFHKIMKSGCKTEESKLRTAERLVNLIATFCIMSWRIFWITMINRSAPGAAAEIALTKLEVTILDHLVKDKDSQKPGPKTLASYLTKVARLGGYLARKRDPPPGNMVMWRGLARLTGAIGAKSRYQKQISAWAQKAANHEHRVGTSICLCAP